MNSRCALNLLAALVLATFALATPGDLDFTFGTGGKVTTPVLDNDRINAVAVQQSDGKIVAAGQSFDNNAGFNKFAVVRYTSTGGLDTNFNTTGKVTTAIGSGSSIARGVAVQGDGGIVVAGTSQSGGTSVVTVVRYTSTGGLDTTFNGTGIVTTNLGASAAVVGVAIQSGKIVVAGDVNGDFVVLRYTSTGALDTNFNSTGMATVDAGAFDQASGLAVQSDGGIVVTGPSGGLGGYVFATARLTSTGALDTNFNSTGVVLTSFGGTYDIPSSVAVDGGGNIVVAGHTDGGGGDFAVVRYTSTGALDTTFNGTGKVTTPIGAGDDEANAVAVQGDGKIIAVGYSLGANIDFALIRYTSTGALDTSFGSGGKVTTAIGSGSDYALAAALQSDGKVVAGGYADVGGTVFALARYQGVVTTRTVTNENDSGAGSLRDAIGSAASGDTIAFSNSTSGGAVNFYDGAVHTIVLTSGALVIFNRLTISGPGANVLTISGNHASRVFDSYDVVTLDAMTIANGKATDGTKGGGIYQPFNTLNITNCTVTGNANVFSSGDAYGGAICSNGTLNISNSTISGNSASASSGNTYGGAIYSNGNGISDFSNITISGNSASAGDGGTCLGGGIYIGPGGGQIVNSTVVGNSATAGNGSNCRGGGICNTTALILTNNTISANSVTAGSGSFATGGGLEARGGSGTYPANTIIAGNTASSGPDVNGAVVSQRNNLIGKGDGSSGLTNGTNADQVGTVAAPLDPVLGPLADNGGPTKTMALLPGSPALDAGSNARAPGATDQRGFPRIVNESGAPTAKVDIGAYEAQGYTLTVFSGSGQSAYTTHPFSNPLVALLKDGTQPLSGVTVTFTAPSSGASGTFGSGATANTDSSGHATLSGFTANGIVGNYNVTGSVTGLAQTASFSLTNLQQGQVLSLTRVEAALNNLATVHWTLTFDLAESGVTASNFSLSGTSTGANVGTPTTSDGGITWKVPVTTGADGTLILSVANDTNTTPPLSNTLPFAGDTITTDITPPLLSEPNGGFTPLLVYAGAALADYAADAMTSDANGVASVMQDPPKNTTLNILGQQPVKLTATDNAGNTKELDFNIEVRPAAAVSTKTLASGEAAPGQGQHGLPGDAVVASFNAPATDDDGDLAFLAKWTSATGGANGRPTKGSGLFLNDRCLAIVGGDATALADDATFKSFSDPVASGGRAATIVGFKGVAKTAASAVIANNSGSGTLQLIAQSGASATADGATFKKFTAVAVAGDYVAFLAQVTGGTPKTTAATDAGVWLKDGSDPLVLMLREGQTITTVNGDKVIKTLVSFASGNGSPGCGRGWLVEQLAQAGARVLALCLFTDKSQAIVQVDAADVAHPIVLSQTGTAGVSGSPDSGISSFARYGLPAANATSTAAFLASIAIPVRPGVSAEVLGRILFVSDGLGTYKKLAETYGAAVQGAAFSVLKDPVLASDGGVAFPATIKGGDVKGLGTATLWWAPPGVNAGVVAQGGARPGPDLPGGENGAQWKAFTSLAIAARRGPIFAATLVPGKGGVTAATAKGVWACDFTGQPRVLFRTGDQIDVGGGTMKKVKSFTLLNAAVGSTGVTRSFNDAAEVVWLATFTDKTTAIVTTEVP